MRDVRRSILMVVMVLLALGVVMIYSSSALYADEQYNDEFYFLKRHLLSLLLGLILAVGMMSFDYRKLQKWAKPFLFFSLGLLVMVLLPGISREVSGAKRWFKFGFISLQPSALAHFALMIYAADFLSRRQDRIKTFLRGFLPLLFALGAAVFLILLEPDLGTAAILVMVTFIICFVGGVRLTHLVGTIIPAIPLGYIFILSAPYRRSRIIAFLNPWQDPRGSGFQIIQSLVALGSGHLFGVGIGQSRQKLFYLPAAHTDFVFSILGEELGFIGAAAVMALFVILLWQATKIALKAKDLFGQLLATGIIATVGLEAIINIGVVTSSLPTKGLPLPFISHGGSALMFNMVIIGLLLNIGRD